MDQDINNLSSENQEIKSEDNKEAMWSIRIFALIIIAVVVISNLMGAQSSKTSRVVVITMSLLILAWSFRPFLSKNEKLRKWVLAGLTALVLLGIVLLFLFMK